MLLFLALAIFYSCSADQDILLDAVNRDSVEKPNPDDNESSLSPFSDEPSQEQTTKTTATDTTTTVADTTNTVPFAIATPSIGVLPLEVTFSVSSQVNKSFAKYEWKFKDGTKVSSAKAVRTFKEAGKQNVILETTDQDGQTLTDSVTVTVNSPENELPVAIVSATPEIGVAPLLIDFTGSASSDDKEIKSYLWDFKDGSSSNEADPAHTFTAPGTYAVELTVEDSEGLTDANTVTITVDEPVNEPPKAVASANELQGYAPLQVDFDGEGSSDDKGITGYGWDLGGELSSSPNPTRTFNEPGVYNIALTVTDQEGLSDTATLTVNVEQVPMGNIDCGTGGGRADDTGHKVWCWGDISIPDYSGSKGVGFSNKELYVDSECYEKQVTVDGNRLRFRVDPTDPTVGDWCSEDYNMRAEIRTAPWNVRHPRGTEEWFGWSYTFGNSYTVDRNNEWLFFQVHNGIRDTSPHVELMVIKDGQFNGHNAGEIFVVNNATGGSKYNPTGITPGAGNKLDIVVHAIWGDGSNGKFQVWINGQKVHDKQEATVYASQPWAGNAKWGIYKWPWRNQSGVQESLAQGLAPLETYMGTLRMITRRPGDADYGNDAYSLVAP